MVCCCGGAVSRLSFVPFFVVTESIPCSSATLTMKKVRVKIRVLSGCSAFGQPFSFSPSSLFFCRKKACFGTCRGGEKRKSGGSLTFFFFCAMLLLRGDLDSPAVALHQNAALISNHRGMMAASPLLIVYRPASKVSQSALWSCSKFGPDGCAR